MAISSPSIIRSGSLTKMVGDGDEIVIGKNTISGNTEESVNIKATLNYISAVIGSVQNFGATPASGVRFTPKNQSTNPGEFTIRLTGSPTGDHVVAWIAFKGANRT